MNRVDIAVIRERYKAQNRSRCLFVSRQTDRTICDRCGRCSDHPGHYPEDKAILSLCDALDVAQCEVAVLAKFEATLREERDVGALAYLDALRSTVYEGFGLKHSGRS